MACEQVVVTLTPVYSPDTLPFRSLTFLSNNDTVPVGRASKSETKNLVPNHDNGWFDSRVMSREHAVIGVKMEDKSVYVRDHGSLHGTQLNDVKITPKQNTTVKSGDVLTFGSEISRGTQTFRPIAVRLDCQWHEKRTVPTKPTTNTFSVPDEDDDVIEVVDYKTVSVQQKSSPWSDSSDMEYGSDMSRPLDLSSPVTSPEIKVSQLPTKPLNEATATTIQQTTLTTEAVVPSSAPFHAPSPEMSEDENQSESEEEEEEEEEEDGSESEDSAEEEQKGMFDEDSDDSEDDHYEGSDWGEDAQAATFSVFEGEMTRPAGSFKVNEVESSVHDEKQAFSQVPNQSIPTNQTSGPVMAPQIQPRTSAELAQQGFTWPEYLIPRVPSPSDKAMAKPMDIPAPAVTPCLASAYQPYNNISPAIQAWTSRNQALTNSFASMDANANESFPFGPHRSSGGYLRHVANDISGGYSLKTGFLADAEPAAVKKVDKAVDAPTRVSIPEIVEAYTQKHPSTSNQLKRKANELEADIEDNSQEAGNTQDSITDAQPRPDMQDLELTQIPETQPIEKVAPTSNEEHRRKRVKPNQAYTFMKYAAVAAVGAVVGSIGTIAGLSSLPADFFN